MNIDDVFDIFELIHSNIQNVPYIKQSRKIRTKAFNSIFEKKVLLR